MTELLTVTNSTSPEELETELLSQQAITSVSFSALTGEKSLSQRPFEEACVMIEQVCQSNARSLDLSMQGLEMLPAEKLMTLLLPIASSNLVSLNVSGNAFFQAESHDFPSVRFFQLISEGELTTLNLSNTGLGLFAGNGRLMEVAESLSTCQLNSLCLDGNQLGSCLADELESFLAKVAVMSTLNELSLMDNQFVWQEQDKERGRVLNLIKPFLNRPLRHLNLGLNPELADLPALGLITMFAMLSAVALESLSLNGIDLGKYSFEDLKIFFEMIAASRLQRLDIGDAMFDKLTATELETLFATFASSQLVDLRAAYLFEGKSASPAEFEALAKGLLEIKTLQRVDLSENDLSAFSAEEGELSFKRWYLSLSKHPSLQLLALREANLASLEAEARLSFLSTGLRIVVDQEKEKELYQALELAHQAKTASKSARRRQDALHQPNREDLLRLANKAGFSSEEECDELTALDSSQDSGNWRVVSPQPASQTKSSFWFEQFLLTPKEASSQGSKEMEDFHLLWSAFDTGPGFY